MLVQSVISAALLATGLMAEGALAKASGQHVPMSPKAQRRYEEHYAKMLGKRQQTSSSNSTAGFRFLTNKTQGGFLSHFSLS